jgi:hypothetical protein
MSAFLSAIAGALIAAAAVWYTWRATARRQIERELLKEALEIQALLEAWHLESAPGSGQQIIDRDLPVRVQPSETDPWLRNVEIRAVLDSATWTYPTDTPPCFGFVSGRRAWIVRDKIEGAISPSEAATATSHNVVSKPALVSSRGLEELCGWVEQVASAREGVPWFNQMLTNDGLRMLDPLLAPLSRRDVAKALERSLSKRAIDLLKNYRRHRLRPT